jgi:hypothetical protein
LGYAEKVVGHVVGGTTIHLTDDTEADLQALGAWLEQSGKKQLLMVKGGYNRKLLIYLAMRWYDDLLTTIAEVNAALPTADDIRAIKSSANAHFELRDDEGGEFVLWLVDMNGTQSGSYGEGVERHISTYQGLPAPEEARQAAITWLNTNAHWL